MKLSHRYIVSCLCAAVLAVVASCAAPPPPTPQVDLAAEAQAIRDISARWMDLAANRDQVAILDLFADDAVTMSDGETPREGRDAIQANMETEWATYPDFTVSWSTTSVDVAASGDLAWERGSWQYDPDGPGEEEGDYGQYITVYKKIDGAWMVAVDIGVSTKPEAETAE